MSLTPKQEAFALAYVETGNASEAYRRAYNAAKMQPSTIHRAAHELIENPKIAARLSELRQPVTQAVQEVIEQEAIDTAWVLRKAVEVVNIGLATVPVRGRDGKVIEVTRTDHETGEEVTEPAYYEAHDLRAANGALGLIAKHTGGFSEKSEVDVNLIARVEAIQAVASLSPEQLRELAQSARHS